MKSIELLLQYAQDKGEFIFPKEMLESALFFTTASAMGLKNIRIHRETNDGDKVIIPNYYGITFINSGAGKDYSLELMDNNLDGNVTLSIG